MKKLIRDIISSHSDAVFDRKKLSLIIETYHQFTTRNDDHIAFFGGNLIGVHPVRFKDEDRYRIIEDICEIIDFDDLAAELLEVDVIHPKRHVSGNPFNYLYPWILNRIASSDLSAKDKEKGMWATMNLFQIKYLTGLDAHYFRHKSDEAIAHAVYEELDKKSLLKRFGNWKAVIEYRSERLISRSSPHHDTILYMGKNKSVVGFVNDIQSRVRKGYGNVSKKFHNLKEQENRILSNSSFATIDGEKAVKEYENNVDKYRRQIVSIVRNPDDLIKEDLINITLSLIDASTENNIANTLRFISDNIESGKKKTDFSDLLEMLVVYIFEFIRRTGKSPSDIPGIIGALRSGYRSHRTSNKTVIEFKNKLDYIIPKAITAKHKGTRSATKVAVLVYISLRILSIPHYNS